MANQKLSPLTLPAQSAPYFNTDGSPTQVFLKFLSALVANPPAIQDIIPNKNPFDFTGSVSGNVLITDGTGVLVSLTRARIGPIPLPMTSGFFPISKQDILTVAYTVAPTMRFIPWGGDVATS